MQALLQTWRLHKAQTLTILQHALLISRVITRGGNAVSPGISFRRSTPGNRVHSHVFPASHCYNWLSDCYSVRRADRRINPAVPHKSSSLRVSRMAPLSLIRCIDISLYLPLFVSNIAPLSSNSVSRAAFYITQLPEYRKPSVDL